MTWGSFPRTGSCEVDTQTLSFGSISVFRTSIFCTTNLHWKAINFHPYVACTQGVKTNSRWKSFDRKDLNLEPTKTSSKVGEIFFEEKKKTWQTNQWGWKTCSFTWSLCIFCDSVWMIWFMVLWKDTWENTSNSSFMGSWILMLKYSEYLPYLTVVVA